ncbi:nitroreductase [Mesocricetibacter intestinalis]|uniref:Putative NAD(P)H nitroreductase n=1 Tax=Mesocricetibacter intestinalis TaxID=1521930 RepID=A0A4R6VET5_9PAST|nr:nitroreductase family protein [Mesocricetibacter intestinalis]TDQ59000.1 nitroreductase [Mesocricetibacter intestinalis]
MDTLTLLNSRRSVKNLTAPGPNPEQLAHILQAALHVPDHGKLHPYRFIVIQNESMDKFETLLKQAAVEFNMDENSSKKIERIARQTPLVIAVVAKIDPNIGKVPPAEQLLSAGCAAYSIQLAANALGFDNVWISGKWVKGSALRKACACSEQDEIIALLRIGSDKDKDEKIERERKNADLNRLVSYL